MLQTREGHQLIRAIELRDPGSELDCLDVWQLPCISTQLFGPTRHIPFFIFLGTVCESQRYSRAGALQEGPGRFGHSAVRGPAVFRVCSCITVKPPSVPARFLLATDQLTMLLL